MNELFEQMTHNVVQYHLRDDGTIPGWLACGPATAPLEHIDSIVSASGSPFGPAGRWAIAYWPFEPRCAALKKQVYDRQTLSDWIPDSPPVCEQPGPDSRLRWQVVPVLEDCVVDHNRFNLTPTLMQSWLYGALLVDEACHIQAELLTTGPCRVWVNGLLVATYDEAIGYVEPMVIPVEFDLAAGRNDLWLQGAMVGWREARLALGMRLLDDPPVTVGVPVGDYDVTEWEAAEAALDQLVIKQFAVPDLPAQVWLADTAQGPVTLDAQASVPLPALTIFQNENKNQQAADHPGLSSPVGKARLTLSPGEAADLPLTPDLLAFLTRLPGEQHIQVCLRSVADMPLALEHDLWASRHTFSQHAYGDYAERQRELLDHLAAIPYDILGALAAVQTGQETHVASDVIALACEFMERRYDCADFYAVSLLVLLAFDADTQALLAADQARIEAAFTGFKFWIDEQGIDTMAYFTENHQILFHTAAYLAGQRWPDRVFTNTGRTGRQQMTRARRRITTWITDRLQGGYSEWDSNTYLAMDMFALLTLVEFADSARLQEMAVTLLNKSFFMLACQSWRGIHGSSHGRCYTNALKTARVELTSGLQRLAWGLGIFNGETRPTGLLALARRYRVPDILQRIGADLPAELTTRAQSHGRYRPQFDLCSGDWAVNTITQRTPDYMLSAAVDYRPGERGVQEHLWQATLSPEALVFTNQPGNSQEHGNARPNFWAGSIRLPRVAMFERTVVCLYQLEADVGLGVSHAYFPAVAFDEVVLDGPWVLARVGEGYLALWSDGDLVQTCSGPHAYQELRSPEGGNVWLCHLGSRTVDGDFATFCRAVCAYEPRAEGPLVLWKTPQGQRLSFAWEGPFLVDGQPYDLQNLPHYENAYTDTPVNADEMIIRQGGEVLKLDLRRGKTTVTSGE